MPGAVANHKGWHQPGTPDVQENVAQARLDVMTLTRAERQQLRSLLACICFDFLELPLELRETIYRLVLMSSSGAVRRVSSPGAKKHETNPPQELSTSILLVSRQTYLEARNVFYRETGCRLAIHLQKCRIGYQLERKDKLAFVNFRQVTLDIHIIGALIEYSDETAGSIGRFLADLVDALTLAFDSRQDAPQKTLNLDFRFERVNDMDDYPPNINQRVLHRKLWYRTQIMCVVLEMRELLSFRVPSLILMSNVENAIGRFCTQKVGSDKVLFRNADTGDRGTLSNWGNGISCVLET
ncbi:hypothetical protein BLS_005361 [Venturia inaequalis]|uniref:Uncharacterized protein n=1 Tax=Venturia inaequalis TaxID=5025 RepID=A0A8H3YSK6_VENIN|nr:hypothetical protein BLS_005361 [Venturia inaequalis]KAE9972070.1 hypothetical protein EG328_005243 [Venturia inaequalis]RDI81660.1 hypothetical protein Vi05172_g8502 [Venturia inaequalis]